MREKLNTNLPSILLAREP
uniref:Uncharacterized protein n=1 Tax=Rhizophora mucronata TaxID=61149 RepID=A0A2P2NN01_RHIMU